MGEEKIDWLHSGGAFNKEPENDLGNYPSRFQIAGADNTMNNIFDDVMPEEAEGGLTDYRCFYIWNSHVTQALECIILDTDQCLGCGSYVQYGSKLVNDIQVVQICCEGFEDQPDVGGYVVFDTEFGAPFTVYWYDWAQFGADLQSRLNEIPWCSQVTVTGTNPYTVEFKNDGGGCGVGNRNVQLMRVVQNHLHLKGLCTFNSVTYYGCDGWNGIGDGTVKVVQPISNYVPQSGVLRIYNPLTGNWDPYPYGSHDDFNFALSGALEFNMVGYRGSCEGSPIADPEDPMNWQRDYPSPVWDNPLPVPYGVVEAPCQEKTCYVSIYKQQEGHPINNVAKPILDDYFEPEVTGWTTAAIPVGNLRPTEGFYMWMKRQTDPGTGPCLEDYFQVRLVGNLVAYPK